MENKIINTIGEFNTKIFYSLIKIFDNELNRNLEWDLQLKLYNIIEHNLHEKLNFLFEN